MTYKISTVIFFLFVFINTCSNERKQSNCLFDVGLNHGYYIYIICIKRKQNKYLKFILV